MFARNAGRVRWPRRTASWPFPSSPGGPSWTGSRCPRRRSRSPRSASTPCSARTFRPRPSKTRGAVCAFRSGSSSSSGPLEKRKNLVNLLEALALVRRAGDPIDARPGRKGRGGFGRGRGGRGEARASGPRSARSAIFRTPRSGTSIGSPACFVFPSLCEGFGLPLLEAMASGLPSAVSGPARFRRSAGMPPPISSPRIPRISPGSSWSFSETNRRRRELAERGSGAPPDSAGPRPPGARSLSTSGRRGRDDERPVRFPFLRAQRGREDAAGYGPGARPREVLPDPRGPPSGTSGRSRGRRPGSTA